MSIWTEPALRAEIDYRTAELRRSFGRRRRAVEQPAPAGRVVRLPRQRTAGPGERPVAPRQDADGTARCA